MIRRILIELVLFALPFGVFFLYRAASRDLSVRDRWPLTALVVIGGGLAIAALVIAPLMAPPDEKACFEAGRYENGVWTPGKEVDCDAVVLPEKEAPPPAATPVAPRDTRVPEN